MRVALAAALLATASACDCGGPGTTSAGPDIDVKPAEVSLDGVPGRFVEYVLEVRNIGNSELILSKAPYFVESDGDDAQEFAVVGALAEGCGNEARRPEDRNRVASGGCARVVFRYLPHGDGLDEAVLRFESNDAIDPVLDVPVHGNAQTPDLEVCAFDGANELGCFTPGAEFLEVDFGISPPGESLTRTLRLRSLGSRNVEIFGADLTGDQDFELTPSPYVKTLEAGQEDSLTVSFGALAGGPREGWLVIDSNDPDEEKVRVRFVAVGDGAKLCLCVGGTNERCQPVPAANFGRVPIGGTGEKYLRLASCGTKPLNLKTVALDDQTGAFGATVPTLPTTLTTGDSVRPYIDVPLTFKPTAIERYEARVNLQTDTEQGYVTLEGEGFESGCRLQAASNTIDFGQVGQGIEARRDYTVANGGTADCVIAAAPTITRGGDVKFSLVAFPTAPVIVAAGQAVKFTVGYTPVDQTTPDEGELSIAYAGDQPGAPVAQLKVQLKGTPTGQPKCVLTASPGSASAFGRTLNFGNVRVNTTKVLPVTFTNVGSLACNITNARITAGLGFSSAGFKVQGQAQTPLQPGQSTTVDVAFTPTSDIDYGAALPSGPGLPVPNMGVVLQVTTSDTVTFTGAGCTGGFPPTSTPGCVGWALTGRGARSDLQVLPPDVDFGLVTLGCRSREQLVTLYNVGSVDINITEIKMDPAPPPEIFKVIAPPVPFTLPGGAQKQISVRYRPPDAQIHTATIFVKSDATNVSGANPYVTVSLKGTGTTETHQTDRFDQNSRPKTDVLFVIDDSGSMSEEQSALATNASRFISVASSLNTDFQIGVTTTDAGAKCGELRGNPKIITPGANAANQFSSTVRSLGTNGSADERGLQTMVCALSDPLINDPAKNKGFLRTDAKLAVVIVSDEEDSSHGTLDFYTDFLKNLKGIHNQSLVTLSAIVGDEPSGCSSGNGDATAGRRYAEVQRRTNGKFRSICSSDWGQIAADLGLDAFGARAGFPLTRVADPATIQVQVNGQPSPATNWTYDPQANSVVFTQGATPNAGATIVIDYEALCF